MERMWLFLVIVIKGGSSYVGESIGKGGKWAHLTVACSHIYSILVNV